MTSKEGGTGMKKKITGGAVLSAAPAARRRLRPGDRRAGHEEVPASWSLMNDAM